MIADDKIAKLEKSVAELRRKVKMLEAAHRQSSTSLPRKPGSDSDIVKAMHRANEERKDRNQALSRAL